MCGTITCSIFARSQSLDLQASCASEARKAFEDIKADFKIDEPDLAKTRVDWGDYQSHYNAKLNRCFMFFTRSLDFTVVLEVSSQRYLIDPVERRHYAFYSDGKRYDGERPEQYVRPTRPPICELTPTLRQKMVCHSRQEFDAFVAEYMEQ
jgi:hypothetical protein